ncbi:MerR family transcriptional regulator [uncultured Dialister sp.]|uniref:MerR family transcriptional regulator n=1 Tax=uncultured Dialister sp. TaxID=278064 RepID=UPI0025DCA85B|nr:MerR family transcriptional regulator [uncultured Dialister sp.]
MLYTAGEAAKILEIPVSTIRYYDKEGLLPDLERSAGGIRMFQEKDISELKLIQCLKKTGLSLKDIKTFVNLPPESPETISERLSILTRQKKVLEEKQQELKEMMNVVNYKLWYYRTAEKKGSLLTGPIPYEKLPEDLKKGYETLHFISSEQKNI